MKLRSTALLRAVVGPEPEKKMSARQLARSTGCSAGFIDHLLAGRRSSCKTSTADRIAQALGVPTEFLFDERLSSSRQHNNKGNAA